MKIIGVMTSDIEIARARDTVEEAAQIMAEIDAGALPLGEGDRLVGIVSLGDIATVHQPAKTGKALRAICRRGD